MNRRGFSLLEVALASMIAMLVVGGSFLLLHAVDRTDRKLEGRFDRATEIEITRRAFQNAFSSIATSANSRSRNAGNVPGRPAANQQTSVPSGKNVNAGSNAPGGGASGDAPSGDSLPPPPAPRILLTPDSGAESDPMLSALSPQRLEMVLTSSPIAVRKREDSEQARMELASAAEDDKRVDPSSDGGARAIRGAFVLRAQQTVAGRDVRADLADRQPMELWWIPLPPAQDDPAAEPLPLSLAAGYPTKLCSNLLRCTYRLYREGQWIEQHSGASRDDLPAYAEVQVEFASGVSARWLMEIDYTEMAEVTANGLESDDAPSAGGAGGGTKPNTNPSRSGLRDNTRRATVPKGGS